MKATSHFAMAHLVFAALKSRGLNLNRTAFVYGNIAPDYIPSVFCAPHFAKACARGVKFVGGRLSEIPLYQDGRAGAEYSKSLGIMCHYICDYFCFAHNKEFTGGMKQHMSYENELDAFLRDNCLDLLDLEAKSPVSVPLSLRGVLENVETNKAEYHRSGYTFENDLRFSFNMCVSSCLAMARVSRRLGERNSLLEEPSHTLAHTQSFATSDCYVFRMFFRKHGDRDLFFLPELMPPLNA